MITKTPNRPKLRAFMALFSHNMLLAFFLKICQAVYIGGNPESIPMALFSTPRTYPPSWIDQLRTTVLWPNQSWTTAETVSILVATRELCCWLTDPRPYKHQHRQGWRSAIADFQHSVTQIGAGLCAALGHELVAAITAVNSLEADVTAPGNEAHTVTLLQTRKPSVRQLLDRLRARWGHPEVRRAAWSDLMEACRGSSVSYETLSMSRDLFWQLVQASEHDTGRMSDHLAGVLTDEAFYVGLARLWLGDIKEDEVPRPFSLQDAGLTEQQQLDLCQRLLTKPPLYGNYVVWIAFDLAGPGEVHRTVGRVSFWGAQWLRGVLEHGGPDLASVPSELTPPGGLFTQDVLPNAPGEVLVRIDLGPGAWTDPVRVATEQAEAVVALASFNVGATQWRRMMGYLVAIDDRVRALASFYPDRSVEDRANDLYQRAMDTELAALAPKLPTHLPMTDPAFSELVQAVHWWQQARRQPPLVAILLHVRVLELLSQRVGEKWYDYLDQYQQLWWVRGVMVHRLGNVIDGCMQSYDTTVSDSQDLAWLKALERQITTRQPNGGWRRDLRQSYDALRDLVRIFPPHDNLGRRIRNAADLLDLAKLPAWRDELVKEWQLSRDRLQRVRNALAHGGPIDEDSAATVQEFAEQLARWSLTDALEGLLEAKGVLLANQDHRRWIERWNAGLLTAASVGDALVGPP